MIEKEREKKRNSCPGGNTRSPASATHRHTHTQTHSNDTLCVCVTRFQCQRHATPLYTYMYICFLPYTLIYTFTGYIRSVIIDNIGLIHWRRGTREISSMSRQSNSWTEAQLLAHTCFSRGQERDFIQVDR